MFSLRVCRLCYGNLEMNAKRCPSCKKEAMDPKRYKKVIASMGIILAVAFSALAVAVIYYIRAVILYT